MKSRAYRQRKALTEFGSEGYLLKPLSRNTSVKDHVPHIVNDVIRLQGKPLDPGTRKFMESRFEHDFSNVRIHDNTQAAAYAKFVKARAFTVRNNIVLDSHELPQDIYLRNFLLAHELAHVIQQERGGSTQPSLNSSSNLEKAADNAAMTVMQVFTPVVVSGTSAPGLARQEKKSTSAEMTGPNKGGHRLYVRVVRFGKTVMEFTEVSGGMTLVDKAMPNRFGEWAVHTEPKAMVRIYNSGIPLDKNTSIYMEGVLNPCSHCDRFLSQIAARYELRILQYKWEYAKRSKKIIKEKGLWRYRPDRLWENIKPGKIEHIPELEEMVKYSRDAGRGSGKKQHVTSSKRLKHKVERPRPSRSTSSKQTDQKRRAKQVAGAAAGLAIMHSATEFANQQQMAAIRTEMLKIGPNVRELRRKFPNKWIVVYGFFIVPPQERLPQLEGAIAPSAQFHSSSVIIADSFDDAEINKKPKPPNEKFEVRLIALYAPKSKADVTEIYEAQTYEAAKEPPPGETWIVIERKETLVGIIAMLNPRDRSLFLDAFKKATRPDWLPTGLTHGYRVRYGNLVLWMSPSMYRLAKTAVEVAVIQYIDERLRFIGEYERKVASRWTRLRNQGVVRRIWQSSVFDINEALKNPIKKASELKKKGWNFLKSKKYHDAEETAEDAEKELDVAWDALNQYEVNQIEGFRARPEGPYAGYQFYTPDEKKLGSARWLVRKAERFLKARKPKKAETALKTHPTPKASIFDDKNAVIKLANSVRSRGDSATVEDKNYAKQELLRVIRRIERALFAPLIDETRLALLDWRRELLEALRMMKE